MMGHPRGEQQRHVVLPHQFQGSSPHLAQRSKTEPPPVRSYEQTVSNNPRPNTSTHDVHVLSNVPYGQYQGASMVGQNPQPIYGIPARYQVSHPSVPQHVQQTPMLPCLQTRPTWQTVPNLSIPLVPLQSAHNTHHSTVTLSKRLENLSKGGHFAQNLAEGYGTAGASSSPHLAQRSKTVPLENYEQTVSNNTSMHEVMSNVRYGQHQGASQMVGQNPQPSMSYQFVTGEITQNMPQSQNVHFTTTRSNTPQAISYHDLVYVNLITQCIFVYSIYLLSLSIYIYHVARSKDTIWNSAFVLL